MVPISDLLVPIILAAVLVWLGSAVVWMVLPHHRADFKKLPDEEAARRALKNASPGQYGIPHAPDMKAMQEPEIVQKYQDGPVGLLTLFPSGPPAMAKQLATWFVFLLVVAFMIAYLAGRTMGPGTAYLTVFRLVGTAAWFVHGVGIFSEAIWFGMPFKTALKHSVDGLFYAVLYAGVFGWLWPGN